MPNRKNSRKNNNLQEKIGGWHSGCIVLGNPARIGQGTSPRCRESAKTWAHNTRRDSVCRNKRL